MLWVVLIYAVNIILVMILSIREVFRPLWALTWIIVCTFVPIVGFLVYYVLSRPLAIRRKAYVPVQYDNDNLLESFSKSSKHIANALKHICNAKLSTGRVQVFSNGLETFDALTQALQTATKTIDVDFYIYRDDHIGQLITNILIDRAQSGVRVRFIRDGLGSRSFPSRELARMKAAGIECRSFFPVRFPWLSSTLNRRDHGKIVIVDGTEAFVGGINVGNEYTGQDPKTGPWRDTELRVVGQNVEHLQHLFTLNWDVATPDKVTVKSEHRKGAHAALRLFKTRPLIWNFEWSTELSAESDSRHDERASDAAVQTVEGGPDRTIQAVRQLFFLCLTQAVQTVDITTPYFAPDTDLTMAMKTAVARGVRVRLLVPRNADHKIIAMASRTYYRDLLEAGVHIYFFDKGILHAKVMTVDSELSVIGAANFDLRSFRLNYEVCQVVYSKSIAKELTKHFERDLLDASALTIDELQQRKVWDRTVEQGARLFAPLL